MFPEIALDFLMSTAFQRKQSESRKKCIQIKFVFEETQHIDLEIWIPCEGYKGRSFGLNISISLGAIMQKTCQLR